MVSATPIANPNPKTNSKIGKNVYHIGGLQVEFPYQPYGSQLAFMSRVISTLDRAQRDGHCHALLESPTGTGKSLSLLCSALAWQQNYKLKNQDAKLSHSKPAPEAMTDPLAYGGGFVPETQPSGNMLSGNLEAAKSGENDKAKKKKTAPTIYYASRTHSQISQVIREYRKTAYRLPMAVLASRRHYCTNRHVRGKENIDEECKLLLKNHDVGCSEYKNMHKVRGHPSLQRGGCHEAHDIEDLVKVGEVVKGCSYYAARSMVEDAQLVFCPYNYIINPVIRGAMEVDIKRAIVIFDEAHNIEDIARDAGSVDVEEDILLKLQMELDQLSLVNAIIYQPLCEMIQDLLSWIGRRKDTLEKREFQHYFSCWTGDKASRELQEANISHQCFPILLDCATKAIKAATDAESEIPHLSGMAVTIMEGLFSSLTYFFSRNGCHTFDYQLALQRYVRRDAKNAIGGWTYSLSLWCLNPAVVFRDIADLSLSIILTSGTLSPVNSFSSELGVKFGTCLEAPHVIDVDSQVWAAIISTGPGNYPLNASYKTADGYAFQDALGKSLEEICNIVPSGSLVFFPSYKLMEKLCNRWRETGQWSRLNARKSLFVEPRGGSQEDFEPVLKGYYDSICRDNKPVIGRKRRVKNMDHSHANATKSPVNIKKEGAAFLAVCRGKVSEGIDFSDDNARVVIVVGIPFPNINDIQVSLKKKYNDTYRSSKNLLSGNEWYCNQAFRALNQAVGRCIRHRFDYGAIILLDERFQEERNKAYISKWLRKSIRQYDNFHTSIEGLKSFFGDVKEQVGKNMLSMSAIEGKIPSEEQNKGIARKRSQKLKKSDCFGQKIISLTKYDANFPQLKSHDNEIEVSALVDKEKSSRQEYIDLDCSFREDLRCSTVFPNEDVDIVLVKETPHTDGGNTITSPGSFCKDENSCSTIIEAVPDNPGGVSIFTTPSVDTLPKDVSGNTSCLIPETELSFSMSVNSHTQKKRRSIVSQLVGLTQEGSDTHDDTTPGNDSCTKGLIGIADTNRRIEFDVETNYAECELKESNVKQSPEINNGVVSCESLGLVMDERLQLFCSLCRNPLGLLENNLYVSCSLTFSSKVHLLSLLKERPEHLVDNISSTRVVVTDTSSVDQRLCNGTLENSSGQGIWREEDGCVFRNIFCPFCSWPNNCLGVQVLAADAANVQFLNKILFYFNNLEIRNLEPSMGLKDRVKPSMPSRVESSMVSEDKDPLPLYSSNVDKIASLSSFGKFSYCSQQISGGWRTTKSKLRLPKKS